MITPALRILLLLTPCPSQLITVMTTSFDKLRVRDWRDKLEMPAAVAWTWSDIVDPHLMSGSYDPSATDDLILVEAPLVAGQPLRR